MPVVYSGTKMKGFDDENGLNEYYCFFLFLFCRRVYNEIDTGNGDDADTDEEIDEDMVSEVRARPSTSQLYDRSLNHDGESTSSLAKPSTSKADTQNANTYSASCECANNKLQTRKKSITTESSTNGVDHSSVHENSEDVNEMMNLDEESNPCANWPRENNSDCEVDSASPKHNDDDNNFR